MYSTLSTFNLPICLLGHLFKLYMYICTGKTTIQHLSSVRNTENILKSVLVRISLWIPAPNPTQPNPKKKKITVGLEFLLGYQNWQRLAYYKVAITRVAKTKGRQDWTAWESSTFGFQFRVVLFDLLSTKASDPRLCWRDGFLYFSRAKYKPQPELEFGLTVFFPKKPDAWFQILFQTYDSSMVQNCC